MTFSAQLAASFSAAILAASVGSAAFGQSTAATPAEQNSSKQIAADLYQFPPKTPADLMEAARVTQSLDRVADSRAFLRQLLDLQLGENELRALRNLLGPGPFLDLRRDVRLRPESEELLAAVNEAINTKSWSAQELQNLVQAVGTPGTAGINAASELLAIGDNAIPVLLAADVQTPSGRAANQILERNARPLRFGLLQQIDKADPSMQVRLIKLLENSDDTEVALRLLRWQFGPATDPAVSSAARDAIRHISDSQIVVETNTEAADILTTKAESLLRQSGSRFSALDEPAFIRALTGHNKRTDAIKDATLLLSDASAIDSDNANTKTISLVANCAAANPSLTSKPSVAIQLPADEILAALEVSLDLHPDAAIELLKGLAEVPLQNLDFTEAGRVLRQALLNPDARVRFLTAHLLRNKLPLEVRHSSVAQSLASAKNGSLKQEMVIVSADDNQLRNLELVFQDAGYVPGTAETGPEGFELAARQMTCELFILSAESPRWPIATTLANLRADVRTRNTPVVVIGGERFRSRVLALAEIHPGVWFIPEPAGTESLLSKLAQVNLPANSLTSDDRATMKRLAQ